MLYINTMYYSVKNALIRRLTINSVPVNADSANFGSVGSRTAQSCSDEPAYSMIESTVMLLFGVCFLTVFPYDLTDDYAAK